MELLIYFGLFGIGLLLAAGISILPGFKPFAYWLFK